MSAQPSATPPVAPISPIVKRITSIKLNNFRAYYGSYNSIDLPKGENMLIYGENGSGKSSLFKALNNYLVSSRIPNFTFTKNRFSLDQPGEVNISFTDFDKTNLNSDPDTLQVFVFNDSNSNNNARFIQDASLVKGFLDYTNLLDVYFHHEPNPNLFELIVLSLLGDHIPISSGGNFKFKNKWEQLQKDLIDKAWTRNDWCHRLALRELPIFETHLRRTLSDVFQELNLYLREYFSDLNIELDFDLKKTIFNYSTEKANWYTTADLRLKVIKDGTPIIGDYSDILNEARLSACAICLYLASVKKNPTNVELKILYLDDIFIGLDASNRIPILKIIQNQFPDFQVFISTYDRHLFELAKQYFETFSPNKWQYIELYVGKDEINNIVFDKPLIIQYETNYGKGLHYLHHPVRPDYPASANYFRKFAESILQTHLPSHEVRNQDYSLIGNFKLKNLINAGVGFYNKIFADPTFLLQLQNALPTLLHPLSHFNLSSPIYRRELLDVQKCLFELEKQLIQLKSVYKNFIPQSKLIKLKINLNANQIGFYEIEAQEMIYIVLGTDGLPILSNGVCHAMCNYIMTGSSKSNFFRMSSNNSNFKYNSIKDAYEKIYLYLSSQPQYSNLIKAQDYRTEFETSIQDVWQSLASQVIW